MRAGTEHHHSGSPGRAGRRARTLDRDLPSQDESYAPHKQLIPTIQYGSVLEGRGSAGIIREGDVTTRGHAKLRVFTSYFTTRAQQTAPVVNTSENL